MKQLTLFWLVQSIILPSSLALLEEPFVAFESSPGALPIHDSPIIFAGDDFKGVRIAAESLSSDLTEITGTKTTLLDSTKANFSTVYGLASAIIVGSINSTIIRNLGGNGTNSSFAFAELEGKWETFSTQVVKNPLPGVASALVIAGSDKRGAIFGVHTLAEQCGQSP